MTTDVVITMYNGKKMNQNTMNTYRHISGHRMAVTNAIIKLELKLKIR
jgi:hypothetical protein